MSTPTLKPSTDELASRTSQPSDATVPVKPLPGLSTVERIEETLAEAEAALDEARQHGDLQHGHLTGQADPTRSLAAGKQPATRLKVSIMMPVYNEHATLLAIVEQVRQQELHDELIIVDDCSTDGTRDLLIELDHLHADIRVIMHGYNKGKGAALRTAMMHARGDIVLVQDADLEYNPSDYAQLIEPIQRGEADVVYGSRYLNSTSENSSWLHQMGNRMLTKASNLTTGLQLTDMETCYKAIRRDALRGMVLRENRFGFEPEITAKLARSGARITERPISYNARGWEEGKKIGLKDGFRAIWCILRYAWIA